MGMVHKQINRVFIDKRRCSSIIDIRFFRGIECDTGRETFRK